jgi:hypothetical protein
MLFDLRSRGRRRTVQAVYLGLAVLMAGGLVLFGVGAGNGFGGILNAFTGGGGSGTHNTQISQQEKQAIRATQLNPESAAAWAALVQARYSTAQQAGDLDPATGTYTAAGKQELAKMGDAWQHYLKLVKNPDPNVAILAARGYGRLGQYSDAAAAWEVQTLANPTAASAFECLAATAYAAKQTRKGDLASAKALTLVPKASQATLKLQLQQAKTNPQVAQAC